MFYVSPMGFSKWQLGFSVRLLWNIWFTPCTSDELRMPQTWIIWGETSLSLCEVHLVYLNVCSSFLSLASRFLIDADDIFKGFLLIPNTPLLPGCYSSQTALKASLPSFPSGCSRPWKPRVTWTTKVCFEIVCLRPEFLHFEAWKHPLWEENFQLNMASPHNVKKAF